MPVQAARTGGEYFAAPEPGPQRRYEALRAYLLDGEPAASVAQRFGYTTTGLYSAVRDFRANRDGARDFFTDPRPGPNAVKTKSILMLGCGARASAGLGGVAW